MFEQVHQKADASSHDGITVAGGDWTIDFTDDASQHVVVVARLIAVGTADKPLQEASKRQ